MAFAFAPGHDERMTRIHTEARSSDLFERNAGGRALSGVSHVLALHRIWWPVVDGSSEELARRIARRDVAALAEAYDAHHEHVRAFARRLLGDASAAEDLVQEAFLALPAASRGFRGGATFRSFVLGVAANHARHHVRAAARRRAAHLRSVEEPVPPSTPEGRTARRELAVALTTALDALPVEQRVAVVLCEVEERSSVEVAEILGVPEGTVRTRVFHAKRKLRELLGGEEEAR